MARLLGADGRRPPRGEEGRKWDTPELRIDSGSEWRGKIERAAKKSNKPVIFMVAAPLSFEGWLLSQDRQM
jgi:hypothetical protein